MNEYVRSLVPRYKSCGLLIDTNILLLYFVGLFDRSWVERFKRTRDRYSAQDFDLLMDIVLQFDRIVTTPNVLSEVSNLSNQWAEPGRTKYFERFAQEINRLSEEYVVSADAAQASCFPHLGLTDAGIMHLAHDAYLVLTDDLELFGRLTKAGVDVINFSHLRPINIF